VRRMVLRICVSATIGSALAPLAGCSDTGDSSSVIVEPCAPPDASVVTVTDSGSANGSDSASRTPLGGGDASVDDGMSTGATPDATSEDASPPADASLLDSAQGEIESGAADAGTRDGTVPDAKAEDSAVADTGARDTGVAGDASERGDGGDSGVDFGALCDTATQFTTGCSNTELAFAEHDPSGSCLTCLVAAGAIDDAVFPDTGHECEDLTDPAQTAACYATLDCILNTNVGAENAGDTTPPTAPSCAGGPNYNISDCYCGAGVPTGTCAALTAAPTGLCTAAEAAGLDLPAFPTTPVLNAYTNTTLGSGMANQIFVAAQQNSCTTCF
jgi:hypothetical protein